MARVRLTVVKTGAENRTERPTAGPVGTARHLARVRLAAIVAASLLSVPTVAGAAAYLSVARAQQAIGASTGALFRSSGDSVKTIFTSCSRQSATAVKCRFELHVKPPHRRSKTLTNGCARAVLSGNRVQVLNC